MNTAPVTARAIRRPGPPVLLPASRFRWVARLGSLEAVTGQVGTLTRAGTNTATDSGWTAYTAAHSMPRWETRSVDVSTATNPAATYLLLEDGDNLLAEDGDEILLETGAPRLGLRIGGAPAEDLRLPVGFAVETATVLVEFVEITHRTTGSGFLLYLGNDAGTGARFTIGGNGTNYEAVLNNGTSTTTASLSTGTPAAGAAARLALQLEDGGGTIRARLLLEILGTAGVTTGSWSTAITRPTSWGSSTKLRLNGAPTGGGGEAVYLQVAYAAGLQDVDEMAASL